MSQKLVKGQFNTRRRIIPATTLAGYKSNLPPPIPTKKASITSSSGYSSANTGSRRGSANTGSRRGSANTGSRRGSANTGSRNDKRESIYGFGKRESIYGFGNEKRESIYGFGNEKRESIYGFGNNNQRAVSIKPKSIQMTVNNKSRSMKQYERVNSNVGTEKNTYLAHAFKRNSGTKTLKQTLFGKSLNNKKKKIYTQSNGILSNIAQNKVIYKLTAGESLEELLELFKANRGIKHLYVIDDITESNTRYVHIYEKQYYGQTLLFDVLYRKYMLQDKNKLVQVIQKRYSSNNNTNPGPKSNNKNTVTIEKLQEPYKNYKIPVYYLKGKTINNTQTKYDSQLEHEYGSINNIKTDNTVFHMTSDHDIERLVTDFANNSKINTLYIEHRNNNISPPEYIFYVLNKLNGGDILLRKYNIEFVNKKTNRLENSNLLYTVLYPAKKNN